MRAVAASMFVLFATSFALAVCGLIGLIGWKIIQAMP
jgi:hypothetical protein